MNSEFATYKDKIATGSRSWNSVMFALALGGLLPDLTFLTEKNKDWISGNFDVELTERGILDLRRRYANELTSVLSNCRARKSSCETEVQRISQNYSKLITWFEPYEAMGKELWNQETAALSFSYYTIDPVAEEEMHQFSNFLVKYKETHSVVLNFTSRLATKSSLERELNRNLAENLPVIAVMQPIDGALHAEIAIHRLVDGSVVTRNTGLVKRFLRYRPAPLLIRPANAFRKALNGVLVVR